MDIVESSEGERRAAYPLPYPDWKRAAKIEAYLQKEGFLPKTKEKPAEVLKGGTGTGIKIHYSDGGVEFYKDGDILSKNETTGEATILANGRTLELSGITQIEPLDSPA